MDGAGVAVSTTTGISVTWGTQAGRVRARTRRRMKQRFLIGALPNKIGFRFTESYFILLNHAELRSLLRASHTWVKSIAQAVAYKSECYNDQRYADSRCQKDIGLCINCGLSIQQKRTPTGDKESMRICCRPQSQAKIT